MHKAIRVHQFGDPSVLKLEEVPSSPLTPTQVRLQVKAVGVNPVETYMRSGAYARKPSLPYIPGSDCAGIIIELGEKVTKFKVGQRVYTLSTVTGAYSEKTICEEEMICPLPDNCSFEQGAGVRIPYATAYRALLQKGRGKPGDTVLVHGGSGGVGLASIQIAKAMGMNIIATAGTQEGLDLVKANGAAHALNHHSENYLNEVLNLTGGKGVDIILEMLANVNLGKDLTVLANFGRVLIIGSRGTVEINPRDLMAKDGEVMGVMLNNTPAEEMKQIICGLNAGLANGTLTPVVGKKFKLSEAPLAHEEIIKGSHQGKIVLIPE